MTWLLQNATALTTILAALIYGFVRVGIDTFYSELGTSAEEVGLTQADVVVRAAITLLSVAVLASVLASVVIAPAEFSLIRRRLKVMPSRTHDLIRLRRGLSLNPWSAAYGLALLVLLLGALWVYANGLVAASFIECFLRVEPDSFSTCPPPSLFVQVLPWIILIAIVLVIIVGPILYARYVTKIGDASRDPHVWGVRGRFVALVSIAALVSLGLSFSAGDRAARKVKSGITLSTPLIGEFGWSAFSNVNAQCVSVSLRASPSTAQSLPTSRHKGMLLGGGDRLLILYIPDSQQTIRLPAADYIVRSAPACRI